MFSKIIFFILSVSFIGFNGLYAQDKSSYRDIVRHMYQKEYTRGYQPQSTVFTVNGKKELWKVYTLENSKQIMEIESTIKNEYNKEIYYSKNGELLYAKEINRYLDKNGEILSNWECEFFLKNGEVYSEISLGHGKTEMDDWDPSIIFKMYEKRKVEWES